LPAPVIQATLIPSKEPLLPEPTLPLPTSHVHSSPILIFVGNGYNSRGMTLLGGSLEETWLIPEEVSPYLKIDNEINYYSLDGTHGSTLLITYSEDTGPAVNCTHSRYWVETSSDLLPFSFGLNSSEGISNLRNIEFLSPQNETYHQLVETYLLEQGIETPSVQVKRILRVDLDNDGTDEVLIEASHFIEKTGHSVSPGDYSFILMRKVSENNVITQRVVGEIYYEDVVSKLPHTYFLQAIADINGNGQMEVLVGVSRWEGNGAILYELNDTQLEEVLRMICSL
jgi:hypothetical protein